MVGIGWLSVRQGLAGLLLVSLCSPCLSQGRIEFDRGKVKFPSDHIEFADLNGDGLEDILSFGWREMRAFVQDPREGFSDKGSVTLALKGPSAVLWPGKVDPGRQECLLVLDAHGLRAMRLSPDAKRFVAEPLIEQPTIVPENGEPGIVFPLAVRTEGRSLLLLPTEQGLEVWRYDEGARKWQRSGVLDQVPQTSVMPGLTATYVLERFLNVAVADVNRDGREDLVIRRVVPDPNRMCLDVHEQTAEGLLREQPSQRIERTIDPNGWLGVYDLNRDGRLDLLETTATESRAMLPGGPAGRVSVRVSLAGADGAWPAEPTVLLRKRDWQRQLPMIDLDGDGCVDLAMGHVSWSSRDDLVRAMEAKRAKIDLRFHFCNQAKRYPEAPDSAAAVTVYTGLLGFNPQQFGTVVRLTGDFNGDGRSDLLVRSGEHDIAIHHFVSRQQPYATRPDRTLRLDTSNPAELRVRDLNGDGISDVIAMVWWDDEPARIYLSRRTP